MIGEIKSSEVRKNKDGETDVLMLTTELADPDDLQSIQLVTQSGEDYHPKEGSKIIIVTIGESFKVAIACDDGIVPTVDEGERRMYSIDSGGSVAAVIYLKSDGTVEINNGGGTAVEFSRLKTAFDQLKSDFDDLVSKYNAHIHATTAVTGGGGPVGVIAPTTSTDSPTTADIDPAESNTVTLP
jgi:hypothetical protein